MALRFIMLELSQNFWVQDAELKKVGAAA